VLRQVVKIERYYRIITSWFLATKTEQDLVVVHQCLSSSCSAGRAVTNPRPMERWAEEFPRVE